MKAFKKWNDLQQFHEVTKNLNYPRIHAALKEAGYEIEFGLKIKLHGTNACVRIEPDGNVVAQKRSSDIGSTSTREWVDNNGFARWVADNEHDFSQLAQSDRIIYIYGEWCGPGVQRNVACSMTPLKTFYIFAIDEVKDEQAVRFYDPDTIDEYLEARSFGEDLIIVPWHEIIKINFLDKRETQTALDTINKMVEDIGTEDPLVKKLFDISGHGEGVVAYPFLGKTRAVAYQPGEEYFSWFNFKAKSEAHRVNKTSTAVKFDPEKFASVQIFADSYCTEPRFEQAFNEAVSRQREMKLTGDFIKWVVQDIWKESKTEREASPELDWKAVSKACSSRAVIWYKSKCQELVE